MLSHWKPLNITLPDPRLPSLLVKYDFGLSNYNIFLTDLTSIWVESLERRQIVRRALNSDTSIDPSENNEQLQLLLHNIQKALDGADASSISIGIGEGLDQLDLSTVTPLPASLKPLQWSFYLDPAPRDFLTVELLLPCLSQFSAAKTQITSLLQQLKEKDHVITRLTDKMRADGSDFSKVFPGAAGIKVGAQKNIRESAGRSVKGLNIFDEVQWRNGFSKANGLSLNISDVLSHVFPLGSEDIPQINIQMNTGTWWQYLKRKKHQEIKAATHKFSTLPQISKGSLESDSSDIDDRRLQTFPAHMRISAREENEVPLARDMKNTQQVTQSSSPEHDDSTTDDSDGQLPPRNLQDPSWGSPSRPSPGFMRDSKVSSKDDSDLNIVHSTTNVGGPLHYSREVTPSILTSNADQQDDVLNEVISPKPKLRLGRIGGKSKPNKDSEVDSIQDERVERHLSISEASNSPSTGQMPVQLKSPSILQETSQERANNKRENLKRELESKSNSRLKKKRKF